MLNLDKFEICQGFSLTDLKSVPNPQQIMESLFPNMQVQNADLLFVKGKTLDKYEICLLHRALFEFVEEIHDKFQICPVGRQIPDMSILGHTTNTQTANCTFVIC